MKWRVKSLFLLGSLIWQERTTVALVLAKGGQQWLYSKGVLAIANTRTMAGVWMERQGPDRNSSQSWGTWLDWRKCLLQPS